MKLTIPRDALLFALERAGRVIERRNTIPLLSNALLRAEGGRLAITGTDLDMEVVTSTDATVATPGGGTLPADTALAFVRKLPAGGDVTLDMSAEGRATLKSGRSRITLNTLPDADFPALSGGEFTATFKASAAALLAMLNKVAFAISTEETRYYLCGIYLHVVEDDGPKLRAVATDGHRLASCQIPAPDGAAGMPGIILPRKAVAEVARLIKPLGKEDVTLAVSASKVRLTSKLIDGTFPDYARVIPTSNELKAEMQADDLGASVERVTAVASTRSNAIKFALAAGQGLTLSVRNPDAGDATDVVDAAYEGGEIEIGFNGAYVLDTLGSLPGKRITMALRDPGSPCLVTAEGDADSLFVLMPMRVGHAA